ncbi:tail fiber protein [Burkholderia gladioli]|uniref:tail fiber protein n=1 Tax=Burkholderia gladioli TaxID=28095 RepID=UPI00164026C4|nr:tail fiber protein [Burkholderia gladioli]
MHRIDHPTALPAPPAPSNPGTPGYFGPGDVHAGTDATWMTHDWANDIQENVVGPIEAAGIALVKGDGSQLLQAIRFLANSVALPIGVAVPFVGALAVVPSNCVVLMGQLLTRSDYPVITNFALASGVLVDDATWLGQQTHRTKFSSGDGASTIRMPDLRGEAIYGADLGRGVRSGSVGDWLDGDVKPHSHTGVTDGNGSHSHTGTTGAAGSHNHGGSTGAAGSHSHTVPGSPGVGEGSGSINSVQQAANTVTSSTAPDHSHAIATDGNHQHDFATSVVAAHTHNVSIPSSGGNETRQRGTGYIYIMRVR